MVNDRTILEIINSLIIFNYTDNQIHRIIEILNEQEINRLMADTIRGD